MAFGLDSSLFNQAVNGETRALNTVVTSLRPHVERQLMRYPVAEEDRHDLLQATLLQVVRRLGSFRGDSSFSTWLFRVTANEALMLMRSQRRHRARLVEGLDFDDLAALPAVNDAELDGRSDVGAANQERDARVRSAMEMLPEDYRKVVFAHYHQESGAPGGLGQVRPERERRPLATAPGARAPARHPRGHGHRRRGARGGPGVAAVARARQADGARSLT